jgi:hypothetical protein
MIRRLAVALTCGSKIDPLGYRIFSGWSDFP